METDFSTTSPTIAHPKTELDESEAPDNSSRARPVVTLEETEALLATLDQGAGPSSQTDFASNSMMLDELDAGPTMTDAEVSSISTSHKFASNNVSSIDSFTLSSPHRSMLKKRPNLS